MLILGIESSCDETAAAVVEDGRVIRSNQVASQAAEHKLYGGVVPEIASRRHIEAISAVVGAALLLRLPLLLVLIAFCMLISSLSDIIQITYFKLTHGKRVFKMAPIHHHFELCGIPEPKIVTMYTLVTVALCLLAILSVA